MTGVAFLLFTNHMVTDPGTTPVKARAQFMFGSSIAVVYGILMELNVTYTLFFALVIVCGVRGLGWWIHHFVERSRSRNAINSAPLPNEPHRVPVTSGKDLRGNHTTPQVTAES